MIEESLLLGLLGYCILQLVVQTIINLYLFVKQLALEKAFATVSDPQKVAQEILKTKIPVMMGPDGPVPMQEGAITQQKNETNPMVG